MSADSGRGDAPAGTDDDEAADDEALSWGESTDRSYVEGPAVSASPSTRVDDDDEDDDDELPEGVLSSAALVGHAVVGAIFLLYTVAWLKSIGNVAPSFDSALADWMWRIGTWFAVGAPAIWFAGTVLLVPTRVMRRRTLAFVVGILVLIPWPFLIGALA